jgi:redox-sensitive bicupin YhaK (pirin superfamily)
MNTSRSVVQGTSGTAHGFIRRMVSPGDAISQAIKPFVFLDFINAAVPDGAGFGFHPHSGIATLTYALDADVAYEDTAGQQGTVRATGLEWMRAGGGTWHQGHIHPHGAKVTSFQLWLALPPELENGAAEGIYVAPEDVPQVGNVRVLLGRYGDGTNPIPAPSPLLYLDVGLAKGERWIFQPPAGHTVAWVFVYRGQALVGGTEVANELVVVEQGEGALVIEAIESSRLLLGSAAHHEHPLVLGSHSVHTSREALAKGVEGIEAVGQQLRKGGRIGLA